MVKDIINYRNNHFKRAVTSTPFITVSDLQKVEKLITAIAAAKGKRKHKIVEKVRVGIKRKYLSENHIASAGSHLSADTKLI